MGKDQEDTQKGYINFPVHSVRSKKLRGLHALFFLGLNIMTINSIRQISLHITCFLQHPYFDFFEKFDTN